MTIIAAQAEQAVGRRRAETDPGDRAPGPVATAFAELSDRHALVDHNLETLRSLVGDLEGRLSPVLPDLPMPIVGDTDKAAGVPVAEDTRGMVARSISAEAQHADRQAQAISVIAQQLGAILDRLEV